MSRIAYVNGRYLPLRQATVHVEDRGFQFADGAYEVITVQAGHLVDAQGHLSRLARSLRELRILWPVKPRTLLMLIREVVRRNRIVDGTSYLQVTRGSAPRDFPFPAAATPSLVITARRLNLNPVERLARGIKVITLPDIRWKRRDIKSVSLLPQVLGKQAAVEAGAFEAWQVDDDGFVTEGCSSNAWIVTKDGTLVTRNANTMILNGITRQRVLKFLGDRAMAFEERPFTVDEAYDAKEAFITSATNYVLPVTTINDQTVGNGAPGILSQELRDMYLEFAKVPA